jgi:hypothetical protein
MQMQWDIEFDAELDRLDVVAELYGITTAIWAIDAIKAEDLEKPHNLAGRMLVYVAPEGSDQTPKASILPENATWLDLFRAVDAFMRAAGPLYRETEYAFIDSFYQRDARTIGVRCGGWTGPCK